MGIAVLTATAAVNEEEITQISIPFNTATLCPKADIVQALSHAVEQGQAGKLKIQSKDDGQCTFNFVPAKDNNPRTYLLNLM